MEEAIARMEYELTHESLSAEREKMIREKKERAEKHDRPAAQRLAQVCVWGGGGGNWSGAAGQPGSTHMPAALSYWLAWLLLLLYHQLSV